MTSSTSALKFTHATPAPHVSIPALSTPAQHRPGRLSRWGRAVWQMLESVGQARARRELLQQADRWQDQRPELAAQLRAAARPQAGA